MSDFGENVILRDEGECDFELLKIKF